jgi:hypothetical protein
VRQYVEKQKSGRGKTHLLLLPSLPLLNPLLMRRPRHLILQLASERPLIFVSILRRLRVVGVGGDVLLAGAGRGGGAVVRRGAGRRGVAELFGFFRVGLEELGLEEGERKSRKGSDGEKVRERR